jgi:hypothetical protein
MKTEEKYYLLVSYKAKSVVEISATNEDEAKIKVLEDPSGKPFADGLIWTSEEEAVLLTEEQIKKWLNQSNPLI